MLAHQYNVNKEKKIETKNTSTIFYLIRSTNTTCHETVAIPYKTKKQSVEMDLIN